MSGGDSIDLSLTLVAALGVKYGTVSLDGPVELVRGSCRLPDYLGCDESECVISGDGSASCGKGVIFGESLLSRAWVGDWVHAAEAESEWSEVDVVGGSSSPPNFWSPAGAGSDVLGSMMHSGGALMRVCEFALGGAWWPVTCTENCDYTAMSRHCAEDVDRMCYLMCPEMLGHYVNIIGDS